MSSISATDNAIQVVCAADASYLPHAAAMIHSLSTHNVQNDICLHFLCPPELTSGLKSDLEVFCKRLNISLEFIEIPDQLVDHLPTQGYLSKVVWYRILIPELLPKLEKILFLDCDVIINDDIKPLWNTKLGDNLFAAVTNVVEERYRNRALELGLSGPQDYFNAGVALWNLSAMRSVDFTATVIDFAKKNHSRLLWLEQDAINSLFAKKRIPLHPRWNYQNGMCFNIWGIRVFEAQAISEARQNPGIIHFEGGGSGKPWHYMCQHPLRKLYTEHRAKTPWPIINYEGRTCKNRIKRILHCLSLRHKY